MLIANSLLDQGRIETANMDFAADKLALQELDTKVRDMCSDLNPELITSDSAHSMKEELQEIASARNEFRNGVRKFLVDHSDNLTSPDKLQWESDMNSLVNLVNQHKF